MFVVSSWNKLKYHTTAVVRLVIFLVDFLGEDPLSMFLWPWNSCQPSRILGGGHDCPDARLHSSAVPNLETGWYCLRNVTHCYNRIAKMSHIHITKEHSIHFSLFKYSIKLSGSLDILIFPVGHWSSIWSQLCKTLNLWINLFLSKDYALFRIKTLKSWQVCHDTERR